MREAGPPRTLAGAAFDGLLGRVVRLNRLFTIAGEQLSAPAGQTLARWLVLAELDQGPATVADVARSLRLARQSVQRVADLLAEEGLAAYEANPQHRRAKLLGLTSSGRDALQTIQGRQVRWTNAVGAKLGPGTLDEASSLLERVLEAVESTPVDAGPPGASRPVPPAPSGVGDADG